MTKSEVLECLLCLPIPEHVCDIDITTENDALKFTWWGDRYHVSLAGPFSVNIARNGVLEGGPKPRLMEALLKRIWADKIAFRDLDKARETSA